MVAATRRAVGPRAATEDKADKRLADGLRSRPSSKAGMAVANLGGWANGAAVVAAGRAQVPGIDDVAANRCPLFAPAAGIHGVDGALDRGCGTGADP